MRLQGALIVVAEQLLIEGAYLSQLGITETDWNIARNVLCRPPDGYHLRDVTLDRVVSDETLRKTVLLEVRNANFLYTSGIAHAQLTRDKELEAKMRKGYEMLKSEPIEWSDDPKTWSDPRWVW